MTEIKASYNEARLNLGEVLPLSTPLSVIIDISERCNFRCSYCFRSKPQDASWGYAAKNNLMEEETFQKTVKQLATFPQKIKSVSLSGHGEPLCHPKIISMVQYLKKAAVAERIEMHTNASLLTERTAREIGQAGFTKIVISLQGLNPDTYANVCGARLDWDGFYRKLRILYENKNNNLLLHIKISEAALDPAHYKEEAAIFYTLFGSIADTVSVEKVTPLWKNLNIRLSETVNKYGQEPGLVECCPILFYKIWVAPDGEIYPCTGLPAPMSLGNIWDTSLLEAWNSQRRHDFLVTHLCHIRKNHPVCADCFVPVNTVTMEKDKIDSYRNEILARLEEYPNG